jgi:hypothetical protein
MHKDYHQPSDDIAHIDFQHMDDAIGSLLEPIQWLVNSDFKPEWNKGRKQCQVAGNRFSHLATLLHRHCYRTGKRPKHIPSFDRKPVCAFT